MSTPPPEVPPPEPPAPGPPPSDVPATDDAPATVGEVRTLRRWLLVAGVWAIAATAIAVIALIAANDDSENRSANERTARDLARTQKELNGRIDDLDEQIGQLPGSEDVTKLDTRLSKIEGDASGTSDSLERLSGRVDDLEKQVNGLEDDLASSGSTTTTETTP